MSKVYRFEIRSNAVLLALEEQEDVALAVAFAYASAEHRTITVLDNEPGHPGVYARVGEHAFQLIGG